MQVKHLSDAKSYEAPNHRGYCSLRLFGLDDRAQGQRLLLHRAE